MQATTDILKRFQQLNVLVLGDVMLDVYLQGEAAGIANEAPVPLLEISHMQAQLGGAANVAANLAALGLKTHLIGIVGKDSEAETLAQLVGQAGISFDPIVGNRPTTQKTRVLSGQHYYLRIDEEEATPLSAEEVSRLETKIRALLPHLDLIVVSDYDKGFFAAASCEMIERLAGQQDIPLCGDIKPQNIRCWTRLDLLTPNQAEGQKLAELLGVQGRESLTAAALAEQLSRELQCQLLLKLAEQGMVAAGPSEKAQSFPAFCQNPKNTSGAGDTVLATAAAVLAAGAELAEAAYLASRAAAIAVSFEGTHAITAAQLREALQLDPK